MATEQSSPVCWNLPLDAPVPASPLIMVRRRRPQQRRELANIVADPPSLDPIPGPSVPDVFGDPGATLHTQPVAFLPLGRTLVHAPGARRTCHSRPERSAEEPIEPATVNNTGLIHFNSPRRPSDPASSRFHRKRERQHERWTADVIPKLVLPYFELLRKTENLRLCPSQTTESACACKGVIVLTTTCVSFNGEYSDSLDGLSNQRARSGLSSLSLNICRCRPAPLQLLERGYFGCAPCFPTLAVDVNVLEFCLELFVRIAPNKTAFCHALEAFLKSRGYMFDSSVRVLRLVRVCPLNLQCLQGFTAKEVYQVPFLVSGLARSESGYHRRHAPSQGRG